MPSIRQEVTTYKVGSTLRRLGTSGSVTTETSRSIELNTAPGYHGLTLTVLLAFSSNFYSFGAPVVGYYAGRDTFSQRITIWLPFGEYRDYYDILRNEKPVFFEFDFYDSGSLVGYGTRFLLTTANEPTGEGSHDVSGALSVSIAEIDTIKAYLALKGIRIEPEK